MTFWASVQRFIVGPFGEKAVNLGERKLVLRWVLGSWGSQVAANLSAFDSLLADADVGNVELLTLPVFLQSVGEVKCIVQLKALKYIEAST